MMIGATEVVDGNGKVIATSTNANLESGSLFLDFTGRTVPAGVKKGDKYTLKAGNKKSYKGTCQYKEAGGIMFDVR